MATQIVDVGRGPLLDVIDRGSAAPACEWLAAQLQAWLDYIRWATLDLSGRAEFVTQLAVLATNPSRLAGSRLDAILANLGR